MRPPVAEPEEGQGLGNLLFIAEIPLEKGAQ